MNITVNGATVQVAEHATIADVVTAHIGRELDENFQPLDGKRLAMAVAINDTVIPRAAWGQLVTDSQHIDLVTAVQGG